MSILIKGNNGAGGSSGSGKGFPPGDATNINIRSGIKNVLLSWEDPEDTIENNTTLSTWSSTIIVRKEGSTPNSIKDGTIILENTERNKCKYDPYVDTDVEVDHIYYYTFYTISTDKIYNDSTSMIKNVKVLIADTVLKNNTWGQIAAASESGVASSLWKVGDEIDLTLSGTYNETVTLQILDFNHFDKSDGSGKAGVVFGTKNLMKEYQALTPNSSSNSGGWNTTYMKTTIMPNILNSMPSNLQKVIKEVNTYASKGGYDSSSSDSLLSLDKVFLLSVAEIGLWNATNKFPIFTDKNSRIKKMSNGSGIAAPWWTRSPYGNEGWQFTYIGSSTNTIGNDKPSYTTGICFCFNI